MFRKIVIVEPVFIEKKRENELKEYCNELVVYDTNVVDEKETIERIGDAKKDIAPTIEFLLSDKSLWTTGAIYLVDGGKSI